jgi:pyruvate dehydrogenase E2 component (dihydrolipoyllysine-residue acetyltransferase)
LIDVVVPKVGEAVAAVRLVRWLKAEGDAVSKGDPLFELDTDKYVIEVEAFADGTVAQILVSAESEVEPMQVVAKLATSDDQPGAHPTEGPPREAVTPTTTRDGTGRDPRTAPPPARAGGVYATPKARRMAKERGISLEFLIGTGRGGMITAEDVEQAFWSASGRQTDLVTAAAPEPLSRARQVIAERMQLSKRTVPHFYLMVDVEMTRLAELRRRCKADRWPAVPTYTDLVVAASAAALAREPNTNVAFVGGRVLRRASINIGIAVAVDDGLLVPVVSGADQLALETLAKQTAGLIERARSRRLLAADTGEKSMVVSNLGMHGVDAFLAIIDVPDPVVLSIGRVSDRCVPVEGGVGVRPMCTLGLSVDHRVLDGVAGARFLRLVADILEAPEQVLRERPT